MASSHGNVQAEPAKMEQIITEFFAKSLHIILESRCGYASSRHFSGEQVLSSPSSSSSSSSSVMPRDKWFNLALRECPAALENIDFWRQSNLEPMVVDVILVQHPVEWDPIHNSPRRTLARNASLRERVPNCWNSNQEEFGCEPKSEKILERWVVKYESRKSKEISLGNKRSQSCTSSHTVYKKSILLLRSLYLTVRLLPAYKLFRELNSSGQLRTYTLTHRVSSLVEPFTRREESEMQRFGFTSVDTSCGRLCLSLLYRSSLSDISSDLSIPMSPQFIPYYVGSPLADPLKRFPSLPVMGMVSHGSPSSSPFSRQHSWSYDIYRDNPTPTSVSFSPSPTLSPIYGPLPPNSLPSHPRQMYAAHNKYTCYEENLHSPVFSPSSSPSQPINFRGSTLSKAPLHCGPSSAPVSIPTAAFSNPTSLLSKHVLPPSPPLKGSRIGSLKADKNAGSIQSTTAEKFLTHGKEETGKLLGVKQSANSSPRISFSRSSSRLSVQDDFDDLDFSCPFDVDDDDMTNPGSRPESFDQKGHIIYGLHESGGQFLKSQGAAVGALVRILQKAPPLNHLAQETNEISKTSIMSSTLVAKKTTSDAFEELQAYRDMKNLLLSRGLQENAEPSRTKMEGI